MNAQAHSSSVTALSDSCSVQSTFETNTDDLRAFINRLESGIHPSISDVMSALNNISEIMTPNIPCIDCEHHV